MQSGQPESLDNQLPLLRSHKSNTAALGWSASAHITPWLRRRRWPALLRITKNKHPWSHGTSALNCFSQALTEFPGDTKNQLPSSTPGLLEWLHWYALSKRTTWYFRASEVSKHGFRSMLLRAMEIYGRQRLVMMFPLFPGQDMVINAYTNFVE